MNNEFFVQSDFDRIDKVRVVKRKGEPDGHMIVESRHLVRPYTDADRELARRRRGRESFSYGAAVCVLPSAHFYRRGEAIQLMEREDMR